MRYRSLNILAATATAMAVAAACAGDRTILEPASRSTTVALDGEVSPLPQLMTRAFNSKATTSSDRTGAEGWAASEYSYPRLTIVSDPAAPRSAPNVGQMLFPAAFAGGQDAARAKWAVTPRSRTLLMDVWVQLSPNWQGPRNGSSIIYTVTVGSDRRISLEANGIGAGTLKPVLRLHNANDARAFLAPNIATDAQIVRGQWERFTVAIVTSTPGQRNGIVRLWQSGRLVSEHLDVGLINAGESDAWSSFNWTPRWGTSSDRVTSEMSMRWDHVIVWGSDAAVPSVGFPGEVPPPPPDTTPNDSTPNDSTPNDTTPPPPSTTVASLDVSPSPVSLVVGTSAQLTATARNAEGQVVPDATLVWTSTAPSIATVSSTGVVNGIAAGQARVIATSGTVADTAAVTVTNVPVARVDVAPVQVSLQPGQATQLTATPRDANGNALSGRVITWTSSNTSAATVGSNGVVTAVNTGSAVIRATSEGQFGEATVTVTAPPPPPPVDGLTVFPGAMGFGVTTPAGRGGAVYRVTNLNDTGTGSLRAAIAATGPRTVIFDVSGTIRLASDLKITNPNITIAGQTAPSPGITLRGATIVISTHDILIQHIRTRVGDDAGGPSPGTRHGFQINGGSIYNVVLDHISASWGIDEIIGSYNLQNVTVSNSFFTEGLSNSDHPDGEHSKAVFLAEGTHRYSFIGNLIAHNKDRNPAIKGNTSAVIANNVIYNWGNSAAAPLWDSNSDPTGKPTLVAMVGNSFVRGPNTPADAVAVKLHDTLASGTKVYLSDNSMNNSVPGNPWSIASIESLSYDPKAASAPLWPAGFTAMPVSSVENSVLVNAGARPMDRDAVDQRIVGEVRARGGRIIDSPSQVGGWPTLAMNTRTLALPANPNGDDDADGYTNLEELLHQLAAEVEGRPVR